MLEIMITPFFACLVLTGILMYFGIHVIEREVIFVDLALAQVAAFGAIIGLIFHLDLHTPASYLFSLSFTFVGAVVFTFTRLRKSSVPQEAIIGIVYAVTAAAAILVLDKIPSETEQIKHMMVGNILFVKWPDILKLLFISIIVAIFHFIFRKKFFLISHDPDEAENDKISLKFWDLLFYISFGIVITSSVEMAGVLLVFSFLIIPAVCSMFLFSSFKKRLWAGWFLGLVTSIAGLYLSASADFPTGPAIVCSFGVLLILIIIVKFVFIK
jgi:zinc/manganese transport system permease protein